MSTDLKTQEDTVTAKPTPLVVKDEGAASYLLDTAKFQHCQRIAMAMASGSLLPDHLWKGRDNTQLPFEQVQGNCFRIVNQALRWQMDPFAIVDETYAVANKLGYQGKLIAAVINARAGLKGRLTYFFSGEGDGRTVIVSGQFADEDEPRTVELSVKQAKTDNKMWRTDPDQKLVYSGATKWARRHCPEIMLGVLTDDDVDRIGVTAERVIPADSLDKLADRLITQQGDGKGEGDEEPEPDPPRASEPASEELDPEQQLQEYLDEIIDAGSVERITELVQGAGKDSAVSGKPSMATIREFAEKARAKLGGKGATQPKQKEML